jgi:DNA-binding LacI/PurR family transcriptional regulator
MPAMKMTRPPTASDVAALAGVSRTTVYHVLNGRGQRFPDETHEKVRAAVRELDYRPWQSGRSLVKGRGDTIIVLLPQTTLGSNIQEGLERLSKDSEEFGSNVVLRLADTDDNTTVDSILTMRPLGVVDLGALGNDARQKLLNRGVPTVPHRVDITVQGGSIPERVAEAQVAELCKHGDRRVVYLSVADPRADPFAAARLEGLANVCLRRGLPAPAHIVLPFQPSAKATALDDLLATGDPLGVAAYNDLSAVAALSAARRLKVSVPSHLSVVGVDGTSFGQLMTPRLSSVYVDIGAIMHVSYQELRSQLFDTELPPGDLSSDAVRLIQGESS